MARGLGELDQLPWPARGVLILLLLAAFISIVIVLPIWVFDEPVLLVVGMIGGAAAGVQMLVGIVQRRRRRPDS